MTVRDDNRDAASRRGRLVAGIVLIVLGVIFFFDRIDLGDLLSDYWPLILIGIGIVRLGQPETRSSGTWLIAIGTWLQISKIHLFGLDYGSSWPLLLVFIGIATVFEGLFGRGERDEQRRHADAQNDQ